MSSHTVSPTLAFDAVIFGLDGTLVTSASSPRGDHQAPPTPDSVRAALFNWAPTQRNTREYMAPGATRALTNVGRDRCAIVTTDSILHTVAHLRSAGVPAPPVIITGDDMRPDTPAHAMYHLAAQRLHTTVDRCLVIDSSPLALAAATDAGCATLAVCTDAAPTYGHGFAHVDSLENIKFVLDITGIQVCTQALAAAA